MRISGLDAYEGLDDGGRRVVVFSGALVGPSWVSIGHILETHAFTFSIVRLGRPYFVTDDSSQLRQVLQLLWSVSKQSSRDEVFVQEDGFLVSEIPRRFDPRVLIAPAALLAVVTAIGATSLIEPKQEQTIEVLEMTCALEMRESEFATWLKEKIFEREQTSAKQLVIQTDIGVINLTIEQTLGSTQLISGTFGCDDGRSITLQFRTDEKQGGGFVELGPKLDP
jgi:hypothetical protein